ncbi:MAG: 50S ribosomal protein L32, partial [Candidatus Cloacimonetes bacterium]|nr:50S ribosomal protein L32 [Candidatus Cloacimonadota bacterium]
CPNCGETMRPHFVCPHCGFYRGKKIISVSE